MKKYNLKIFNQLCRAKKLNTAIVFEQENKFFALKHKTADSSQLKFTKTYKVSNAKPATYPTMIKTTLAKLQTENNPQIIANYLKIHELIRNS